MNLTSLLKMVIALKMDHNIFCYCSLLMPFLVKSLRTKKNFVSNLQLIVASLTSHHLLIEDFLNAVLAIRHS